MRLRSAVAWVHSSAKASFADDDAFNDFLTLPLHDIETKRKRKQIRERRAQVEAAAVATGGVVAS